MAAKTAAPKDPIRRCVHRRTPLAKISVVGSWLYQISAGGIGLCIRCRIPLSVALSEERTTLSWYSSAAAPESQNEPNAAALNLALWASPNFKIQPLRWW